MDFLSFGCTRRTTRACTAAVLSGAESENHLPIGEERRLRRQTSGLKPPYPVLVILALAEGKSYREIERFLGSTCQLGSPHEGSVEMSPVTT